jgi:hypothetical protein
LYQCLKYIENDKKKRIDGDVKPFGVHEINFNDAQYFLPKPATIPGWLTRKATQRPFNEGTNLMPRQEKKIRTNSTSNPGALELRNPEESRAKKWSSTSNMWLHPKPRQSQMK